MGLIHTLPERERDSGYDQIRLTKFWFLLKLQIICLNAFQFFVLLVVVVLSLESLQAFSFPGYLAWSSNSFTAAS